MNGCVFCCETGGYSSIFYQLQRKRKSEWAVIENMNRMRKCSWNDWRAKGKKGNDKCKLGGNYQRKQENVSRELKGKMKAREGHWRRNICSYSVRVSNWLSAADVFNTDAVISFTPGKNSYTVFHLTLILPYSVTSRLGERFLVFVYYGEDVFFYGSEILYLKFVLRHNCSLSSNVTAAFFSQENINLIS